MTAPPDPALAVALVSEVLINEQLLRARLTEILPRGMQVSHFSVLNHLASARQERTPAELARILHVTRAAITNTLKRLEWAGYVHIRPDWDDARSKRVTISPAGRTARDQALAALSPLLSDLVTQLGETRLRAALPVLRDLREELSRGG